ncbi:MAG: alanine:cation symporter family protein, partial [SAR324 cluster bacterium]|nr:alanine:cation symporter family protein [SAR324 cluster bacterium]
GSSPIAAAAAKTNDPVKQALVSMTQTFLDTLIVCSITGLVIVSSGAWQTGATGAELTIIAFKRCLGEAGSWIVPVGLIVFAYSTMLGWGYYGEKAIEYLAGVKASVTGASADVRRRQLWRAVVIYRWIFCAAVFVGAVGKLEVIWTLSDILNGLMALPNLIALIALAPIVLKETRRYYSR